MTKTRSSIRIISDGTPLGTKVLDSIGLPISGVARIEIAPIVPNELISAKITFILPALDIQINQVEEVNDRQNPAGAE
jgi:hypothetical protein